MTTATSEQLLEEVALRYVEHRSSFADLYSLAAEVLPDLVHSEIKRATSFVGAILNAEVEFTDDDERRNAILSALLAARGIEILRLSTTVTSSSNRAEKSDLLTAVR